MSSLFSNQLSSPPFNAQEFNIAIIGSKKVGKTQFCNSLTLQYNKNFKRTRNPQTGIEQFTFIKRNEETLLKINLWDYKARDENRPTQVVQMKHMHGCFIIYDTTCKDSLTHLVRYYKVFKENSAEKAVCIILGSKMDLLSKQAIAHEEIDRFTMLRRIDALEISSLKNFNLEEALDKMTNQLLINFDSINNTENVLNNISKFDQSCKSSQVETGSFKGNPEHENEISKESEEQEREMSDYSVTDDPEDDRNACGFVAPKEERKGCCNDNCQIF